MPKNKGNKNFSNSVSIQEVISEEQLSFEEEIEENGSEISQDQDIMEIVGEEVEEETFEIPGLVFHSEGIYYQALTDNSIIVSIRVGNSLPFTGKAKIKILRGAVEICGHFLNVNSPMYDIYSPRSVPANVFCIRNVIELLSSTESILNNYRHLINQELYTNLEKLEGSIIVMQGFEHYWNYGLRALMPEEENYLLGFPMIGNTDHDEPFAMEKLGFQLELPQVLDNVEETVLIWNALFDEICNNNKESIPKIGIFGGQNTGKSSLARWLTNRFLNQYDSVLYIDLDPGQPEFTASGMISVVKCDKPLLEPNYAHLTGRQVFSIYLGSTNASEIPLTYIAGLYRLLEFIKSEKSHEGIPWIVNTMGFVTGIGLDLTCEVLKSMSLNFVLQIVSNVEVYDFSFELTSENVATYKTNWITNGKTESNNASEKNQLKYKLIKLKSIYYFQPTEEQPEFTGSRLGPAMSKKSREIAIISYFASVLNPSNSYNFCSVVPFTVPCKFIIFGLDNPNRNEISYDKILRMMNGNLVALAKLNSHIIEEMDKQEEEEFSMLKVINYKESKEIVCFGYGLVRAIDLKQQLLYIVTPIPSEFLKMNINCLIPAGGGGTIELPKAFFGDYFNSSSSSSTATTKDLPYIMNTQTHRINSRLHNITKKIYVPNRKAAHNVLRKCLL